MHLNLSADRLLHLLVLIAASAFFGFIVNYWTESGLLFSFSGGVTIAVQLSNVIEKFWNPLPEGGKHDEGGSSMNEDDGNADKKRPNRKQIKSAQRRGRGNTISTVQ